MNKKFSMIILAMALFTSLNSFAEESCQYQVVLNKKTNRFASMGATLLLKSPQDLEFGTVKVFTDSAQMGYHNSCEQMLQFLSSNEGQFLTRGCRRMKYECTHEAIWKATQSFYAN